MQFKVNINGYLLIKITYVQILTFKLKLHKMVQENKKLDTKEAATV